MAANKTEIKTEINEGGMKEEEMLDKLYKCWFGFSFIGLSLVNSQQFGFL